MPHPVVDNGGTNVTAVSASNIWIGWYDKTSTHALHWDGRRWHTLNTPADADPGHIVPDGKGGYWFGATAIWTGGTWLSEPRPGLTGGYIGVVRIPRTASFLLTGGVETGASLADKPAIFRFDL